VYGSRFRNSEFGALGGGTVGYNFQISNFVVGVVGDIEYQSNSHSFINSTAYVAPLVGTATRAGHLRDGWFETVRPRLGYALDRTLFM
jgi:outer membrane immunogenic protein